MTVSEQLCLLPEGAHEGVAALHGAKVTAGAASKVTKVRGAVVGHGVMLELTPDAFDRITGCRPAFPQPCVLQHGYAR